VLALCAMLAGLILLIPLKLETRPTKQTLTKNIEDVQVGDVVLAWDESTDELVPRNVLRTFYNTSDHVRLITIQMPDGNQQTIETTDGHPFYVVGHGWTAAGDLQAGHWLTTSDGRRGRVIATNRDAHPEGIPIFNFEVEGSHNYFVSADGSTQSILVHNQSPRTGPRGPFTSPGRIQKVRRTPQGLQPYGRPLTVEQARRAVRRGADIYTPDRDTACQIAGRGAVGPETHPRAGENRFPHYHTSDRAGHGDGQDGGHIFFGRADG
jgi:hypothetical protein